MSTEPIVTMKSSLLWILLLLPAGVPASEVAPLEEIVVTAQKRQQSLQDVPVAVTAFSERQLELSGARTIEDVQTLAPSLTVTSVNTPGNSTQIQIRGVGTSTTNVGLEAAVGFFLDGVYRSRSGMAVGDLIDVERIEVLRGPQGTVFGKNTSAGAISVITHAPDFETSASAQLDVGNYDARTVRAVVNTPLFQDRLAFRLSGSRNVRDGYIEDVATDAEYNDLDRWNTRTQLFWTITDRLDVRMIADWSEASESSIVPVRSVNGPLDASVFSAFAAANGGVIIAPADPAARKTSLNDLADSSVKDRGVSVEANYDAGWADVTAIAAWRSYDSEANKDVDFSAVDFFRADFDFREDFFSTELRAAGTIADAGPFAAVDWLAGLYYSDEEIRSKANFPTQDQLPLFLSLTANSFGIPLAPGDFANGEDTGMFQDRGVDGTTFAVFGHATVNLTARLGFTGGLRYNREEKNNRLSDDTVAGPGNVLLGLFVPAPDYDDLEFDDDEVTGEVSAHVQWTEDLMTYVKYARGYKSGGINLDAGGGGSFLAPEDPSFDSELSDSWELGLRSRWMDGRAVVNLTGYMTEFDDFQVQSFNGVSFLLRNASGVESSGFELETQARPIEGLSITAGVTYADAKFDDDVNTGFADVGGKRLPLSSKWTGSVTGTYERAIPSTSLSGFAHVELYARSQSNLDSSTLDPVAEQEGYSILNARIGVAGAADRWSVALWCRNCADKDYAIFTFASPFQVGSFDSVVGQPRTWGVSFTASL